VKTRITDIYGDPFHSIDAKKERHILNSCKYYMTKKKLFDSECRIDAIGILIDTKGKPKVLKYIRNAIEDEEYP
jgi:Holliday junction resolvase-like predicted endonuclease